MTYGRRGTASFGRGRGCAAQKPWGGPGRFSGEVVGRWYGGPVPSEPLILWTDASCYENVADGVAGIAVANRAGEALATQILWGCRSAASAEIEAVRLAFRLCRHIDAEVEIRSDSLTAIRNLTAPKGIHLCHGYRGDNTAHDHARKTAREARERAQHSMILTRLAA